MFNFALFVCRAQPFHLEHYFTIARGLTIANKVVIALGSANRARSTKNPWTSAERESMIRACFPKEEQARLLFVHTKDHLYNDELWINQLLRSVDELTYGASSICLLGADKDYSSFYLKMFPTNWTPMLTRVETPTNATDIRNSILSTGEVTEQCLPSGVVNWIKAWINKNDFIFHQLQREYAFITEYKSSWASAPYEPTFVTTDAVVVCNNHVLTISRRAYPDKGLLALPGGFLGSNERLLDSCIRELREETKLKVPEAVLRGRLKGSKVFDHPDRSTRGRTITHAFYFVLDEAGLPKVRGGDDARAAQWINLSELRSNLMYEDHAFILEHFTGVPL